MSENTKWAIYAVCAAVVVLGFMVMAAWGDSRSDDRWERLCRNAGDPVECYQERP